MNTLLRIAAGIALAFVLALGGLAGFAVLPVATVHVQTGSIPNGMALRIDVRRGVHLRVATTAEAGGKPRFEYRMTSLAEPFPDPLELDDLSPRCVSFPWAKALGQGCQADLFVVVKAQRPVRIYCEGKNFIPPEVGGDVFVEDDDCNL
jgi:hypothetical protein